MMEIKGNGSSIAGRMLITGGFISALMPYGVFFGILPYLVGVIFLWSSDLNKKSKLYWSFVPLLLWAPILWILFGTISFVG